MMTARVLALFISSNENVIFSNKNLQIKAQKVKKIIVESLLKINNLKKKNIKKKKKKKSRNNCIEKADLGKS